MAIKSIRKEKIHDEQDMVHIRREIEIMSALRHPHIISIHEGRQECVCVHQSDNPTVTTGVTADTIVISKALENKFIRCTCVFAELIHVNVCVWMRMSMCGNFPIANLNSEESSRTCCY